MMKLKLFLFIASLFLALPSFAQTEKFGIAAIVNDFVITNHDVKNRIRLLFLESGLEQNQENLGRLSRVSRDQLIDEALQRQQVEELGVSVPPQAIARFIADLEKRNNLATGGFKQIMQQSGIDYSHFEKQQFVRLAWNNFLQRQLQRAGDITQEEITNYIAEAKARKGEEEVYLREIFLPYASPLLEAKTNALANDILGRLANGADFGALANSFSASRSAANGGDLGWVPLKLLDEEIQQKVLPLQVGQVSTLIERTEGAMIVKLEGRRTTGADGKVVDARQAEINLRSQKIDLLHRQTLHRLKNDAFIELR